MASVIYEKNGFRVVRCVGQNGQQDVEIHDLRYGPYVRMPYAVLEELATVTQAAMILNADLLKPGKE